VPKDIKLAGGQEAFTVTVSYDTRELYGKVQAERTLSIAVP